MGKRSQLIIGAGIFLLAGLLFVWLVGFAINQFSLAETPIQTALIAMFGSVSIFLLGRLFERNKDAKRRAAEEKIVVYKKFVDFYFRLMAAQRSEGEISIEDAVVDILDFQKDLIFWGSDTVIVAYADYKDLMARLSSIDLPVEKRLAISMTEVAKLLAAMRRDIGYTTTTFNAKLFARLHLADDDETRRIFKHL